MKKEAHAKPLRALMLMLLVTLCLFAPADMPFTAATGTVTAEAATETDVKSLTKGKSYTLSGYAKVTSSNKKVATVKKKSTKKYTVTGVKKGTATIKCYDSNGKLTTKVKLIVTDSSSFKYDTSAVVLAEGKTKTITATVQNGCTVEYSISDSSTAIINRRTGKITAYKIGTDTITGKIYYEGKVIKTFKRKVFVVSYDTSAKVLAKGKTKTVTAVVPSGCTVEYSSSKTSVATVSSKGEITAKKAGTATITAKVYYKGKCAKTFKKKIVVVSYDTSAIEITVGKSATVAATVPSGCSVSYSSSNQPVASVDSKGKITAKKAGAATITAKISYDGKVVMNLNKQITIEDSYPGYSYEVYLIGPNEKLYNRCDYPVYIKTDNPDPSSFNLDGDLVQNSLKIEVYTSATCYDDIPYLNYQSESTAFRSVPGGYVGTVTFWYSGECNLYLIEYGETTGRAKKVASVTVNILDYDKAESEWIDSVISKCTTSDMDPFEKMDSICIYLESDLKSGFTYLLNYNGYLCALAGYPQGPYFVTKRWDSCISPAALTKIAERLGEFDYIHNCYGDTDDWKNMHCKVKIGIGSDIRIISACPTHWTGELESITMLNMNDRSIMTKIM
ncbi:MAG: Ig-like domain-containing protein [Clostridiales bacterium]|nr:Ig-like domain-containing protein [Clostridiales bacterium]